MQVSKLDKFLAITAVHREATMINYIAINLNSAIGSDRLLTILLKIHQGALVKLSS